MLRIFGRAFHSIFYNILILNEIMFNQYFLLMAYFVLFLFSKSFQRLSCLLAAG